MALAFRHMSGVLSGIDKNTDRTKYIEKPPQSTWIGEAFAVGFDSLLYQETEKAPQRVLFLFGAGCGNRLPLRCAERKELPPSRRGKQMSTGHLHLIGSIPDPFSPEKETPPTGWCFFLEQGTGIEPAFTAWETTGYFRYI